MVESFAIDPKIVQELVEQTVRENILSTLEAMVQDANWLAKIEVLISQTATQKTIDRLKTLDIDKIVSDQVKKNFTSEAIQQQVTSGVQNDIATAISTITQDPKWLDRIEQSINQAVVYQTIAQIGSIDINSVINERVDENMENFHNKMREDFSSVGIEDQATQTQLTIMDEVTVFENELVTNKLTVADAIQAQHLTITGSVNTDNQSWVGLIADISDKTLQKINADWQDQLVEQITERIKTQGIDFNLITIEGQPLISGNQLASTITQSNLQNVGVLHRLRVSGETSLHNNTVTVTNKRVGVNTEEPETALSIWDEEVAVNIGKTKLNQAYIGTSRAQSLSIGTNRVGHINIDADGMTQIKKLRIGVHQISHADMVPGWSGTKGDIVFNTNIKEDRVFAWVCLGNFKWQPLKSAE